MSFRDYSTPSATGAGQDDPSDPPPTERFHPLPQSAPAPPLQPAPLAPPPPSANLLAAPTRDEYFDALSSICPHNMIPRRCRTYNDCKAHGNVHRCPEYANGCPLAFKHPGWMHTTNRCKKGHNETCDRKSGDGRLCRQQVDYVHVDITCQRLLENNGYCDRADCEAGHDYPDVRIAIKQEAARLGAYNVLIHSAR
ncbi:hypothetical protein LTR72_002692 [Exophiala xenobiotica]|nr:hypothetical protein LTR72_002692 [Exophiala xenobiotica]KAK5301757.1 hypothetical protein LTR14_000002 [Exophiala xenobiotica]